jgi:hypothetical protein
MRDAEYHGGDQAAWLTLALHGGTRADRRITAAVNTARRHAWAQAAARHGALPGVRLADRTLDGVTCIRLDATVTAAHSDKELAEANFKGYGTGCCTPRPAWSAAGGAAA